MNFLILILYEWFIMPFSITEAAWKDQNFSHILLGLMLVIIHAGFLAMYLVGLHGLYRHSRKKFLAVLAWTATFCLVVGMIIFSVDKIILHAMNLY